MRVRQNEHLVTRRRLPQPGPARRSSRRRLAPAQDAITSDGEITLFPAAFCSSPSWNALLLRWAYCRHIGGWAYGLNGRKRGIMVLRRRLALLAVSAGSPLAGHLVRPSALPVQPGAAHAAAEWRGQGGRKWQRNQGVRRHLEPCRQSVAVSAAPALIYQGRRGFGWPLRPAKVRIHDH